MIATLLFVAFLALLFLGVPIGAALGLAGAVCIALANLDVQWFGLLAVPQNFYAGLGKYPLLAIPMGLTSRRQPTSIRIIVGIAILGAGSFEALPQRRKRRGPLLVIGRVPRRASRPAAAAGAAALAAFERQRRVQAAEFDLDLARWPAEDAVPWLTFPLPVTGPFTGYRPADRRSSRRSRPATPP